MTFATFQELKAELAKGKTLYGVSLTAALAADILNQHKANRPIKSAHVKKLCQAQQGGFWNDNPPTELYFFRNSYQLADGQHRCHMVVTTGIPISVNIIPDVDSMVGHDEHAPRTVADHLAMEGIENASVVAKVAKSLFDEESKGGYRGNAAVLRYFHENQEFCQECAARAKEICDPIIPANLIMAPAQVAIVRAWGIRVMKVPAEKVDEYLELAVTGSPDREGAARDFYEYVSGKTRNAPTATRVVQMAIIGLDLFLKGKRARVENLQWKSFASKLKTAA